MSNEQKYLLHQALKYSSQRKFMLLYDILWIKQSDEGIKYGPHPTYSNTKCRFEIFIRVIGVYANFKGDEIADSGNIGYC